MQQPPRLPVVIVGCQEPHKPHLVQVTQHLVGGLRLQLRRTPRSSASVMGVSLSGWRPSGSPAQRPSRCLVQRKEVLREELSELLVAGLFPDGQSGQGVAVSTGLEG